MNKKNLTKVELRAILEGYKDAVTDKSLKDRIGYTLKKYGESTKKTVLDLIEDIEQALKPAPLPIENSAKPTLKKSGKKSTPKKAEVEEEPEVTEEEATEPEPEEVKEKPKKSSKSKVKKSLPLTAPKSVKGATDNSFPMSAIFPERIEDDNMGTLVAVPNKYHTLKELVKAVSEEEKTVLICAYYSPALIKKYGYTNDPMVDSRVPKKGFPHDLDVQQVVYCCESIPRVYTLSDYSEGMFVYNEDDLVPVETVDSTTNEKVAVRYANGVEFEIYEIAEQE